MIYRLSRGIQNLEKITFSGVGRYNLPIVPKMPLAEYHEVFEAPFNYFRSIRGYEARQRYLLHFFIDDYQFERVWERPDYYLPGLREYAFVVMPDFSTYKDFPLPIRLYNLYRNRWLAAYWGMSGVKIIPQAIFGKPYTYDVCFEGMPIGGVHCISSVGIKDDMTARNDFIQGFNAYVERLKPELVLFYGNTFPGMTECNMQSLTKFTDELEARKNG